jgi:hypothetical protein
VANLYVAVKKPQRVWPYYGLVIATLLLNLVVPITRYLELPGVLKTAISCFVVFAPIFFAGVVFAMSFRTSKQPDVDFGSNLGGVILGGLSENASLIVGFSNLLLIAILYYVLSATFALRRRGVR